MKTQDKLNCMAQVIAPPVSKGYYGGTCTLAIQGSNDIQLGALKVGSDTISLLELVYSSLK